MFVLCLVLTMAADEAWEKVRAVKSGVELRIYQKGGKPPLLAKLDEATEESLVVVVKDTQTAIPKDQVERIDYRPPQTDSRMKREAKTTKGVYDAKPSSQNQPMSLDKTPPAPGTTSSSSSSVTFGSKAAFELLYRARSGAK